VDASNADFIHNPKHMQVVLDALDREWTDGQHYLSLP
jgi:deoxyguanosine kinase